MCSRRNAARQGIHEKANKEGARRCNDGRQDVGTEALLNQTYADPGHPSRNSGDFFRQGMASKIARQQEPGHTNGEAPPPSPFADSAPRSGDPRELHRARKEFLRAIDLVIGALEDPDLRLGREQDAFPPQLESELAEWSRVLGFDHPPFVRGQTSKLTKLQTPQAQEFIEQLLQEEIGRDTANKPEWLRPAAAEAWRAAVSVMLDAEVVAVIAPRVTRRMVVLADFASLCHPIDVDIENVPEGARTGLAHLRRDALAILRRWRSMGKAMSFPEVPRATAGDAVSAAAGVEEGTASAVVPEAGKRHGRPPTDERLKIATYYKQSGLTQKEVAEQVTQSGCLGRAISQETVSRAVTAENKWRRANPDLRLPQIATRKRKVTTFMDPAVLDMGKRQDGWAPRQRPRPDNPTSG